MAKINVFRTSDLLQGEQKWLKSQLDARLGLTLGVDVVFVTSSSEALQAPVVVALGGPSRAILMGVAPQSDPSSRGLVEGFADRTIVTTWGLADAIKDSTMGKEFLVDMLRARVYAYGLGNRNTDYVSTVGVSGENLSQLSFSVETYEEYVSSFGLALGLSA